MSTSGDVGGLAIPVCINASEPAHRPTVVRITTATTPGGETGARRNLSGDHLVTFAQSLASEVTPQSRKGPHMYMSKADLDSAVFAAFYYEFIDGDVDVGLIERIHRGEVDDWISHVAGSGLFSNSDVCAIAQGWLHNPKSLLDALFVDVDEITVRGNVTLCCGTGGPT